MASSGLWKKFIITKINTYHRWHFGSFPKIDEILARLQLAKYSNSIDLRGGYHHITLSPKIRHKCAFTTIFGKYEFLSMLLD